MEWRSVVFPTFDERRGPSSFECPLISSLHSAVFYEVKRTSTKNTYPDKLRTDTFRFAHNVHDRNILFFFFVFGDSVVVFVAGALHFYEYVLFVGTLSRVLSAFCYEKFSHLSLSEINVVLVIHRNLANLLVKREL